MLNVWVLAFFIYIFVVEYISEVVCTLVRQHSKATCSAWTYYTGLNRMSLLKMSIRNSLANALE